jgi:hypothetical protein
VQFDYHFDSRLQAPCLPLNRLGSTVFSVRNPMTIRDKTPKTAAAGGVRNDLMPREKSLVLRLAQYFNDKDFAFHSHLANYFRMARPPKSGHDWIFGLRLQPTKSFHKLPH